MAHGLPFWPDQSMAWLDDCHFCAGAARWEGRACVALSLSAVCRPMRPATATYKPQSLSNPSTTTIVSQAQLYLSLPHAWATAWPSSITLEDAVL